MRYLLGYFALTIGLSGLSLLAAGQALGFVLILIAAALVYLLVRQERARRRERRFGEYGPAIEGYGWRLGQARKELEAKLPEEPLDNPAVVDLLSAYEHEEADEGERVRAEYAALRERFLEWQREFEHMQSQSQAGLVGIPERFAEHYDELDRRLSTLAKDVERLEARAAEIRQAVENPLDEIARAALKLEQATATCRHSFAESVPADLEAELSACGTLLEEAREALAKGAERPLAATRIAREVYERAAAVDRRADELVRRPAEVGAAVSSLTQECERLDGAIAGVKAKLAAAAEMYAPASLLEIQGLGAGAEQAVAAARGITAKGVAAASPELEQAREALARAADLVTRIESHLAALEQASQEARHDVEEAELAVDRAWASITSAAPQDDALRRAERIVAHAREVAAEARKEMEHERPDWFRAVSLAKRASELVHDLSPERPSVEHPDAAESPPNVEHARMRAEAALASARPLVTTADGPFGLDNMTSLFLEQGEQVYAKGVALQGQIDGADDPDAIAHAAMDAFRLAEDAAAAAREHAFGLRAVDGTKSSGRTTAKVVWGSLGASAFFSFD